MVKYFPQFENFSTSDQNINEARTLLVAGNIADKSVRAPFMLR